jgi:hypothetical protein
LKILWEYCFLDLFSNGKIRGLGPQCGGPMARSGSTVDHGRRRHWARRCLISVRRTSARACQSSPAVVEGDEGDEAVPEGHSPEDERQRRGDAMMVKSGSGLSSARSRSRKKAG